MSSAWSGSAIAASSSFNSAATLLTGPDLVDAKPRPSTLKTVREQNGPGFSAASIKNPEVHQLKAGDMIIIPAGTGHWFTKIDDHIRYVMVRIDAGKIRSGEAANIGEPLLIEERFRKARGR